MYSSISENIAINAFGQVNVVERLFYNRYVSLLLLIIDIRFLFKLMLYVYLKSTENVEKQTLYWKSK